MPKNKWGGYCPSSMSWNSGRLKKGDCTAWQHHLYNSWYSHGDLICGNKSTTGSRPTYNSIIIAPCFYDFQCFVNVIKQDPLFPQFIQNPELYDIDKDGLYKEWSPRSVQIVLKSQNQRIMHQQNRHIPLVASQARARGVRVNGVDYTSQSDAARALGVDRRIVWYWVKTGRATSI